MFIKRFEYLRGTLAVSTPVYWLIILTLLIGPAIVLLGEANRILQARRNPKGLRRLGLINHSNLKDQHEAKYDKPEDAADDSPVRVKGLAIHPIKSCAPVELNRAQLTKTGFAYDRVFAFAEERAGRDDDGREDHKLPKVWQMRSQRKYERMSQVHVEVWVPHKGSNPRDPLVQASGCLVVSFPHPSPSLQDRIVATFERGLGAASHHRFVVPMLPSTAQVAKFNIQQRDFLLHRRTASGLDMSRFSSVAAALPLLKSYLGIPRANGLALLRCTPDTTLRTTDNLAPLDVVGHVAKHGYTDQQPVNMNSLASVHAVSALLPRANQPLKAQRFRANIWITGAPAFAEDGWKRVSIHSSSQASHSDESDGPSLSVVCRTGRCELPNVDPDSGTRDRGQPLKTLVAHRKVDSGSPRSVLGVHCVPEERTFAAGQDVYISVGDEVRVLERGEHVFGSTGKDY